MAPTGSGADSPAPPSDSIDGRRSFDVCLIIPLREEFDYARDVLCFEDPISDGNYYLYPFSVPGSSVTGIAVVLFDMGLAAAAVAATRLLEVYKVRVLALVGIAGALSPDLRLGDVVIASSVDEYLHKAKAKSDAAGQGVEFELSGVSWQAAAEVVNYVNNFRYLPDTGAGFTSWRERAKRRRDPLLAASFSALARDVPDYVVGVIATGDVVGAAESFARWLRQTNRSRVAIEMEAGGAARAIYRHPAHLIVVRGISDRSDERKAELDSGSAAGVDSGAWRKYATHNAVDFLVALLANPQFPWPDVAKAGRPADHARVLESWSTPDRQGDSSVGRPADNATTISIGHNTSEATFIGTTKIHGDLRIGGPTS